MVRLLSLAGTGSHLHERKCRQQGILTHFKEKVPNLLKLSGNQFSEIGKWTMPKHGRCILIIENG
jgi:hypothetical protein